MEVSIPPAEAKSSAPPQNKPFPSPLDQAFQLLLQPLKKSLARIEARLAESDAATPRETIPISEPVAEATQESVLNRLELLSAELADFRRALLDQHSPIPAIAEIVTEPMSPIFSGDDSWAAIVFGSELSSNVALASVRKQFLDDVMNGVVPARALAGQLLLLQATPADELPERFRHVGEAYYRWRPRTTVADDLLEQALADWLTKRADEAGLRNSIQLVRPGDRFDSTRHAASTRGVEVIAVHGWVVLRDNTKVYTKASVSVQ
jgi:hypothetical protein